MNVLCTSAAAVMRGDAPTCPPVRVMDQSGRNSRRFDPLGMEDPQLNSIILSDSRVVTEAQRDAFCQLAVHKVIKILRFFF